MIYEGIKRAQNSEKMHFRGFNRQKNNYSCRIIFLSFQDQVNFLQYFEKGDALECWMHKLFRLGPSNYFPKQLKLATSLVKLIKSGRSCSKLATITLEQRLWRSSSVSVVEIGFVNYSSGYRISNRLVIILTENKAKDMINSPTLVTKNEHVSKLTYFHLTKVYILGNLIQFCISWWNNLEKNHNWKKEN